MPTPQENLARFQEIARRGLQDQLPPEIRSRFDEAVNRNLVTIPVAQRPGQVPGLPAQLQEQPGFFRRQADSFIDDIRPLVSPRELRGAAEMLLTMSTGAVSTAMGGAAGTVELISGLVSGDPDALSEAVDTITEFQTTGTFRPRTRAGEEAVSAVSRPFQALFENVTRPGGEAILSATGSPELAAAFETVAETFPPTVASARPRGLRQRIVQNRGGQQQLVEIEGRTGVDIGARAEVQGEQFAEAAAEQTGGRGVRAQDFDIVQDAIVRARERTRQNVDDLFTQARETNATIPVREIQGFADSVRNELTSIDIRGLDGNILENRQVLAKRLSEIDAILNLPENASIKLNALSQFRSRLNRNTGDASQNVALGIIKGELDSFLNTMFESDMVSGDAAGIQRWQDARQAFQQYRDTFSDQRTIRNLATNAAEAPQIRNWIFGASVLGAKPEASAVVNRIADIVGRDSPEFTALRQDALFEIMQPLLQEEPNLRGFINNYDRFVTRNDALNTALFPDSAEALKDLRDLASSTRRIQSPRFQLNFARSAAAALFGHEIAQGRLRQNIATQVFEQIANTLSRPRQRQVAADLLGYDPGGRVLPISAALGGGAAVFAGDEQTVFPPISQLPN